MARKDPLVNYDGPRLADGHRASDVGNGDRLVAAADGRLRYVRLWRKFICYHDGVWIVDVGDVLAREWAKRTVHNIFRNAVTNFEGEQRDALIKWAKQSESAGRLSAMLVVIKGMDGVIIEHDELDQRPELLNVANGVVDLRTGALLRHDPEFLITKQLTIRYEPRPDDITDPKQIDDPRVLWQPREVEISDPNGTRKGVEIWRPEDSSLWARCLGEWQPDRAQSAGPSVRDYLQLSMGAGATGYPTQRLDIHWGDGGNGKGVFFDAVGAVLDPYFVVPHKSLIVRTSQEPHETVVAELAGARLVVAPETQQHEHLDEAKVKNMTGKDVLGARRVYEDRWKFRPSHSMNLHCNYKPVIRGTSQGIWRRVFLVPWIESFVGRENEELPEQLAAEADGILRWIVAGAVRWLSSGRRFDVPETIRIASERYRSEANPLHAFLKRATKRPGDPGVERAADLFVTSESIYGAYLLWRTAPGVDHEVVPPWLTQDEFVKELTDRGFERDRRVIGGLQFRGLRGLVLQDGLEDYVKAHRACCPGLFEPSISDLARSVQNTS
jgi:putative DNA primase/helicase